MDDKKLRKSMEELLGRVYSVEDGRRISGYELLAQKVFKEAMKGNLKAFEIIRDTIGQGVPHKIITSVAPEVIDEIEMLVLGEVCKDVE